MKLYYRYIYWITPSKEETVNQRFSPGYILSRQSKVLGSICRISEDIVPENRYVDLGNGIIADWRYGIIEADDATLSKYGWDGSAIKEEMSGAGQNMRVKFDGSELTGGKILSISEDLRKFTDLTEREPGLFVVSEATETMGQPVPEKLIDLRLP